MTTRGLWDKFRFGVLKPLVCRVAGHRIVCYRVVSDRNYLETDYFMWWCHRCMDMRDYGFPCGGCDNGCRRSKESGSV